MDPATSTATELLTALTDRSLSSVELLDAMLARIDQVNPALNAVVTIDADGARARAVEADAARERGESWGPLHGLPMTIKDVWETEGMRTTSGAPELSDHVPGADAVAVARLRDAGAIIVGKTNTPLYAWDIQTYNDVFGVTNNPWDVSRTTGGSSGGAAAAVATGMTTIELGSDIGGSIRNPSHFCGVYGLKPTWGVIPTRGHIPGRPGSRVEVDVNCAGPIARSVEDLELAFDVLAGPVAEDAVGWRLDLQSGPPIPSLAGLRIAMVLSGPDAPVSAEVQDRIRALADRLTDAGAQVSEVPPPVSVSDGFASWRSLVLPIMGAGLPDKVYEALLGFDGLDDPDFGVQSAKRIVSRYRDWAIADEVRQEQRLSWARFYESYDLVLAPIMPVAAFPHDHRPINERVIDIDGQSVPGLSLTAWAGWIGSALLPVVVVPAGRTPSGLPVGVQLVGPHLQDRRLLRMAALVDAAGEGFVPPPLVLAD